MTDVGALWAAIDPDDYRTLDAALDHLRASLSEGLCPFCFQALDSFRKKGLDFLICQGCETGFPAWTPPMSTERVTRDVRQNIGRTLMNMKGSLHDTG